MSCTVAATALPVQTVVTNDAATGQQEGTTLTTKGDVAYMARGVNAPLLGLFFKLARGLGRENLQALLRPVLAEVEGAPSKAEADAQALDLFLLMANTRSVRHGKGEKDLFFDLLFAVGRSFPNQCVDLLRKGIVSEIGSYKDVKILYNRAISHLKRETQSLFALAVRKVPAQAEFLWTLASECIQLFKRQLEADARALDALDAAEPAAGGGKKPSSPPPKLSLAAKWAPRENKPQWAHMARALALHMFPLPSGRQGEKDVVKAMRQYRKTVARLNVALKTCEVKMCNGEWSEIHPGSVPSQCLKRKRKAFLNLPCKRGNHDREERNAAGEDGARSSEVDRVVCARNFQKHLEAGKSVHGRALHANEIVGEYMAGADPFSCNRERPEASAAGDPVLEAQWKDICKEFLEKDSAIRKYVAMADVSGSMFSGGPVARRNASGRLVSSTSPITCCIALSLLIAEIAHPVFRNRVLTFDSNPEWFNLNAGDSLAQKVAHLRGAPWGGSTNFYLAMRRIVESCVEAGLAEEDLPKGLVVFSDMQFDAAGGGRGTDCMDKIEALWQEHGYACAPRIIFWNLAANTDSFPAHSGTENVQMVSGFSQNLVKAFVTDTELEVVTPEETLRALLSEGWLDGVRSAFDPDSASQQDAVVVAGRGRLQDVEALLANLYPDSGDGTRCGDSDDDNDSEGEDGPTGGGRGRGRGHAGRKRKAHPCGDRGMAKGKWGGKAKGKGKGKGGGRYSCRRS